MVRLVLTADQLLPSDVIMGLVTESDVKLPVFTTGKEEGIELTGGELFIVERADER